MKALAPLILLALALMGGYWYYTTQMGGSANVEAPTDVPDVNLPDAGEAADGAADAAKKGADGIAGLPPVVWTTFVPVGVFALAVWWLWKDPKRRSVALLVAVVALVVLLIGRAG